MECSGSWTSLYIGTESRGAAAPPKNILASLGDLRPLPPPENCILSQTNAVGSRRRPFFREHLLLGQKRGPNWDKKAVQIRRRLFFRERLFLRKKNRSKSGEDLFLFFVFLRALIYGTKKRGPNWIKITSIWRFRFCPPVQK